MAILTKRLFVFSCTLGLFQSHNISIISWVAIYHNYRKRMQREYISQPMKICCLNVNLKLEIKTIMQIHYQNLWDLFSLMSQPSKSKDKNKLKWANKWPGRTSHQFKTLVIKHLFTQQSKQTFQMVWTSKSLKID